MADKRFSLTGKSYPAVKGGMVHKGAQGTAENFKNWLGKEVYEKALKAKRFVEVKAAVKTDPEKPEPKKRGPNKKKAGAKTPEKTTGEDTGGEEGEDSGEGENTETETGGGATGGATRK